MSIVSAAAADDVSFLTCMGEGDDVSFLTCMGEGDDVESAAHRAAAAAAAARERD